MRHYFSQHTWTYFQFVLPKCSPKRNTCLNANRCGTRVFVAMYNYVRFVCPSSHQPINSSTQGPRCSHLHIAADREQHRRIQKWMYNAPIQECVRVRSSPNILSVRTHSGTKTQISFRECHPRIPLLLQVDRQTRLNQNIQLIMWSSHVARMRPLYGNAQHNGRGTHKQNARREGSPTKNMRVIVCVCVFVSLCLYAVCVCECK